MEKSSIFLLCGECRRVDGGGVLRIKRRTQCIDTRALAKELAPSNIQVNAIACGVIDTDMNKNVFDEEEMNMLVQEIPADRLGRPEEVAALVVQSYVRGMSILQDRL